MLKAPIEKNSQITFVSTSKGSVWKEENGMATAKLLALHANAIKYQENPLSLSRPYTFTFFKGCLPKILLGALLNTLYPYILESKS